MTTQKRHYTMTPAALAARSKGGKTHGKKNLAEKGTFKTINLHSKLLDRAKKELWPTEKLSLPAKIERLIIFFLDNPPQI